MKSYSFSIKPHIFRACSSPRHFFISRFGCRISAIPFAHSISTKVSSTAPDGTALLPARNTSDIVPPDDEGETPDHSPPFAAELFPSSMEVVKESLNILEWPSVCRQLAKFTLTSRAKMLALDAKIPFGDSKESSQTLLDQTECAAGLESPLSFSGVQDISSVVHSAVQGQVCTVEELWMVATTLKAGARLESSLEGESTAALQDIFRGVDCCHELQGLLEHCLDGVLRQILDRASDELKSVRESRAANEKQLLKLLRQILQKLSSLGAINDSAVVQRRNRLCVGVRAGFKSLLVGGVTLDVSNSGATLFIEPQEAIHLNNRSTELSCKEADVIASILRGLTEKVAQQSSQILDLQDRITVLDLASARAMHSKWLKAVKPTFSQELFDTGAAVPGLESKMQIEIKGVLHPVLLERWLQVESDHSEQARPVPIDFTVNQDVHVVAITGPNTGGKTAAMKTLGMASLMAKAGLFVCAEAASLPWFDFVLADIGDEQSLQQSLSTFSGHIRRMIGILGTAGSQSLALLDELGSGTDPIEGASLARAILRHLAASTKLTVATTHYAELSNLKATDKRFENACVEFDMATLSPTYRLLWGQSGQSNAFAIAESRGFDPLILARARELVVDLKPADAESRASDLIGPLMIQRDTYLEWADKAQSEREKLEADHQQLQEECRDLEEKEKKLKSAALQEMTRDVLNAKQQFSEQERFLKGSLSGTSDREYSHLFAKASGEVAKAAAVYKVSASDVLMLGQELSDSESEGDATNEAGAVLPARPVWCPKVGDQVIVRRFGQSPVPIVAEIRPGEEYNVQFGKLKVTVKLREMLPSGNGIGKDSSVEKVRSTAVYPAIRSGGTSPVMYDPKVQTKSNTIDLRGMRVDEAMQSLDIGLASRRPGAVVFIVHGLGTGMVKKATLNLLKKHPSVARFESESGANLGCTIAFIN